MPSSEQEHAILSSSNMEEEGGGKEEFVITNDSGPLLTEELSSSSSEGRLSRALIFLEERSHRRLMGETLSYGKRNRSRANRRTTK